MRLLVSSICTQHLPSVIYKSWAHRLRTSDHKKKDNIYVLPIQVTSETKTREYKFKLRYRTVFIRIFTAGSIAWESLYWQSCNSNLTDLICLDKKPNSPKPHGEKENEGDGHAVINRHGLNIITVIS